MVRPRLLCLFLLSAAAASGLSEIGRLGSADNLAGAEISAYVSSSRMLAVTSGGNVLTFVSMENPSLPKIVGTLKFSGEVPSVSAHGNTLAVCEKGVSASSSGKVHLYEIKEGAAKKRNSLSICQGPDMLQFSPDGKILLVACEGESDLQSGEDPDGAIGLVDVSAGMERATFQELDFSAFDSLSLARKGVRLFGPGSYLQNLEPEYISFSPDGLFAFATLQENNAVAKIDVPKRKIVEVQALGAVDRAVPGNEFDFRDDKRISLENAPVRGYLQPDGICAFESGGRLYYLTADEGESRRVSHYSDETTAKDLFRKGLLDKAVFSEELVRRLGKLPVDAENPCDGEVPCRYVNTFGGRSASLFDACTGERLWNSGGALERALAKRHPELFNWNSKKGKVRADARSDKKGPEPENVAVGETDSGLYAFVGMERSSGIAVFSLKNPQEPELLEYLAGTLDRGPEGILFISKEKSPLPGIPLLIVGYEYSRTLVVYRVFY